MDSTRTIKKLVTLEEQLAALAPLAIAVSGGIDSMLLAYIANRKIGSRAHLYHAQSPAVPGDALYRIKRYASRENWQLTIFNAQDFSDKKYLSNPVNRCYFCKTNLYREIAKLTNHKIATGTNIDDLNDYRPGLIAAEEEKVHHPYVNAGISKDNIRDIAKYLSLNDISDLPASPCLSSRVETGIRIEANKLLVIDEIENSIRKIVTAQNVRLRFRKSGALIEIDKSALITLTNEKKKYLIHLADKKLSQSGYQCSIGIEPYNMGNAFLRNLQQ